MQVPAPSCGGTPRSVMESTGRISASETEGLCAEGEGPIRHRRDEWLQLQQQELLSLYVSIAQPASHNLPWRVQIISIGSSGMQKTSQCIPVYRCHVSCSGCCTFASASVMLCSCRFQLEACLLQGCGSAVRHRCDSGRNAGDSLQGQLSGPKHMDGGAVSLCRGAQVN